MPFDFHFSIVTHSMLTTTATFLFGFLILVLLNIFGLPNDCMRSQLERRTAHPLENFPLVDNVWARPKLNSVHIRQSFLHVVCRFRYGIFFPTSTTTARSLSSEEIYFCINRFFFSHSPSHRHCHVSVLQQNTGQSTKAMNKEWEKWLMMFSECDVCVCVCVHGKKAKSSVVDTRSSLAFLCKSTHKLFIHLTLSIFCSRNNNFLGRKWKFSFVSFSNECPALINRFVHVIVRCVISFIFGFRFASLFSMRSAKRMETEWTDERSTDDDFSDFFSILFLFIDDVVSSLSDNIFFRSLFSFFVAKSFCRHFPKWICGNAHGKQMLSE